MADFLVDTQTLSCLIDVERALYKGQTPDANKAAAADRLATLLPLYVSIATHHEIERGLLAINAARSLRAYARFVDEITVLSAEVAGRVNSRTAWQQASHTWAASRRKGFTPADDHDVLIVATAQIHGLTLITHDGGMRLIAEAQEPPVPTVDWLA